MSDDSGGWLWFTIDVVFVAIFAAALIAGSIMWQRRRRNPAIEQARDRATHEAFESDPHSQS